MGLLSMWSNWLLDMSRRCDYAVYQATVVTNGVFLCYSVCVCVWVFMMQMKSIKPINKTKDDSDMADQWTQQMTRTEVVSTVSQQLLS